MLAFCHFIVIGFTLFARFNPFGRWCSYNVAENNGFDIGNYDNPQQEYGYLSLTKSTLFVKDYQGDSMLMLNLALIQLTFCIVQVFGLGLPLYRTPIKDEDSQVQQQDVYAKYTGVAKPGMLDLPTVEY